MFDDRTNERTYWPKIDIKDRIWTGYARHIRPFITTFAQRLSRSNSTVVFLTARTVALALLLGSGGGYTLDDFDEEETESDGDEDPVQIDPTEDDDGENTSISDGEHDDNSAIDIEDESATENEVLEKIELENWAIPIGYEEGPTTGAYAVIYDRYSSDNQDVHGCVNRIKSMLDEAEERDIPLYFEPVVDIATSGKGIDREGIRRIIRLVQHPQIQYFFVHDVTRLARRNSFCLFIIDLLTRNFDVEVVTKEGTVDLSRLEDLATTWVSSMAGEITNRNKARNTLGGMIEKFEEGSISHWYKYPPIGYSDAEENDALFEKEENEIDAAKACFTLLDTANENENSPYTEVLDHINSHFGPLFERYETESEHEKQPLSRRQLKRIVRDPIYIGEPVAEGESIGDQGQESEREDPDLQIIDEELFKRVNEKVDRIENEYSDTSSAGEVMDLEYLSYEFGFLPIIESTPEVAVHCPECDAKMVRDGKRESENGEQKVPIYKCQKCPDDSEEQDGDSPNGTYKTYPNTLELYKIRLFDKVINNIDEVAAVMDLEDV